jgi:hypothetical protein
MVFCALLVIRLYSCFVVRPMYMPSCNILCMLTYVQHMPSLGDALDVYCATLHQLPI